MMDTYDLRTPLQLSVERGDNSIEITKMLLESPDINVNARSESIKHQTRLSRFFLWIA
jgi:hypothetical protein